MTIDRSDASASLADIATVQRRTREAWFYAGSSTLLMVWGGLVAAGYLVTHFDPPAARPVWIAILVAGLATSFAIRIWRSRAEQRPWDGRIHYALLAIVAFGIYWSVLIDPVRGREMAAFWPTLFMLGYVLAGFWLGRFFIVCGLVVTALTVAGYFWLGPWFYLWMALVSGGGLMAGGLWLRKAS
jgi:hypothetical protein